ncbi:MAG: glycine zipper domain-containing protein [Longimicrobiales bacterium]
MIRKTTHRLLLASCAVLLASCSAVESADAPSDGSGVASSRTLASGTRVEATLRDAISSRTARVGDVFVADVVRDITNGDGTSVIPAGSTVQGSVTEVSPANNTRSAGTLTLAMSTVTVEGATYQIDASIDALETVDEERGVEKADVARVAGGAAAGAILGRVIGGNTQGTVIGGAVGAVTGAAVSVAVKDMDIALPAGARLALTLRSPFSSTPR